MKSESKAIQEAIPKKRKYEYKNGRREGIMSKKKRNQECVLYKCKDGTDVLKVDKLIFVLLKKPDGRIVSESFTTWEYSQWESTNREKM